MFKSTDHKVIPVGEFRERSRSSLAFTSRLIGNNEPIEVLHLPNVEMTPEKKVQFKDHGFSLSKIDSRRTTASTTRVSGRDSQLFSTREKSHRSQSNLRPREKSLAHENTQHQSFTSMLAQNRSRSISNIMNWFHKDTNIFLTGKTQNIIEPQNLSRIYDPTYQAEILFGSKLDKRIQDIEKAAMIKNSGNDDLFDYFLKIQESQLPIEFTVVDENQDTIFPNLILESEKKPLSRESNMSGNSSGRKLPPGLQGYLNPSLYKKTPNRKTCLVPKPDIQENKEVAEAFDQLQKEGISIISKISSNKVEGVSLEPSSPYMEQSKEVSDNSVRHPREQFNMKGVGSGLNSSNVDYSQIPSQNDKQPNTMPALTFSKENLISQSREYVTHNDSNQKMNHRIHSADNSKLLERNNNNNNGTSENSHSTKNKFKTELLACE